MNESAIRAMQVTRQQVRDLVYTGVVNWFCMLVYFLKIIMKMTDYLGNVYNLTYWLGDLAMFSPRGEGRGHTQGDYFMNFLIDFF